MSEFSTFALFAVIAGFVVLHIGIALDARRTKQKLLELNAKLDVFVEASTDVARCVDRLVVRGPRDDHAPVASRRWLLGEAKARLTKGVPLEEIVAPLGLSRDEARLLRNQERSAPLTPRGPSHESVRSSP